MSQRPLTGLDLPRQLTDKLSAASIHTSIDLISKCPIDLMKLLGVPLCRVNALLAETLRSGAPVAGPVDALTLFRDHRDNHVDLEEPDTFDLLLNEHELLKTGILTEICGPPGVGKTQFLTKVCSTYLLDSNRAGNTVIYIDTENNFSPER
jgi:RAD51-like protein 1